MVQTVTGPPSVTSEESLSSGKNGKIVGSKRKSSSGSTRRASTTKNMEKHMADAPYPLLSMLSTDKWYGQKVIVSTGPLANHVGHVEKWGNGWVSVKLPNIGLHNRRSFELYLHPEEKSAASSTAEQLSNDNQVTEPDSEITDRTKEDSSPGIERDIRRCISRDNDSSPTPVPAGKDVMKSPTTNIHEITPLTSCKVVGIDHHKGNKSDNKKVKNIMFPLMNSPKPDTVPESPLTTSERIISKAAASSDVERKESDEMKEPTGKFHLPIKTQEGDDMPLVDLLAKEGHLRKGKFGLLFGTAALERSRRSVHRPTWYEPETSAKKREHKEAFIAEDSEVTNKRKRIEAALAQGASIELVSSSSDEDSTDLAAGTVSV